MKWFHSRRVLTLSILLGTSLALTTLSWADDDDIPDQPDGQLQIELLGFTEDGTQFGLKVLDDEGQGSYQLRQSSNGKQLKIKSFLAEEAKKYLRGFKRRYKIKVPPADNAENARRGITLLATQKEADLIIYAMKGKKILQYDKIPLKKGKKGKPAKATVKFLNWDPKGKFIVIVYNQKVKKRQVWAGDAVKAFRFLAYKADFGD
jgi:hypothetical protein